MFKTYKEFQLFENTQDTLEEITAAINNHSVCVIDYKGESEIEDGIRNIEPYVIGLNDNGNTVLRAWLIDGTSRTGKRDPSLVPGWRLFRLDRIFTVSTSHETFDEPKKGYNPDDKKMSSVTISAQF